MDIQIEVIAVVAIEANRDFFAALGLPGNNLVGIGSFTTLLDAVRPCVCLLLIRRLLHRFCVLLPPTGGDARDQHCTKESGCNDSFWVQTISAPFSCP